MANFAVKPWKRDESLEAKLLDTCPQKFYFKILHWLSPSQIQAVVYPTGFRNICVFTFICWRDNSQGNSNNFLEPQKYTLAQKHFGSLYDCRIFNPLSALKGVLSVGRSAMNFWTAFYGDRWHFNKAFNYKFAPATSYGTFKPIEP